MTEPREWFTTIGTLKIRPWDIGGCRIRKPHVMCIAGILYSYTDGDPNGISVFPSIGWIAVESGLSYDETAAAIAALQDLGLVEVVDPGGGEAEDQVVCRLVVPADLADRVGIRRRTPSWLGYLPVWLRGT